MVQYLRCSGRDRNGKVYVMNADGSNVRRLTNNSAAEAEPGWHPDLFYITSMAIGKSMLRMRIGSNLFRLTVMPNIEDSMPSWSR
jgi:hypothetical protein